MNNQVETLHLDNILENYSQDMSGKIAAITGTTSGTGFICARELAKKGATVILLNRESERSKHSLEQLRKAVPGGNFDPVVCDLQDFQSVRNATQHINANYEVIDVLVNNAGVMALKDIATKDGYDVQIQTNCISHFLITSELFQLLRNSKEARIVNHTSMARLGGPLEARYFEKNGGNLGGDGTEAENLSFQGPRWQRYHQTKLANCAFTYGLKQKLEAKNLTGIIPLLAHPGLALTNLQVTTAADGGMDGNADFMAMAQSAEDGATGIIRAAIDPNAKPGDFFGPSGQGWKGFPELLTPEDYLYSEENIKINWEGCENAVGAFKM